MGIKLCNAKETIAVAYVDDVTYLINSKENLKMMARNSKKG